MIYVFISSPLYLNRRNLSCCRFWLITRISINYTFCYLIIFRSMPCRWVFVTLGVNFASKICLNKKKRTEKEKSNAWQIITTLKCKHSHDCTKSYYSIGYSIHVQSPKVVDMKLIENDNKRLACENIRFSSLFAAGDVSRGGTSATQRQKFHTDDAN